MNKKEYISSDERLKHLAFNLRGRFDTDNCYSISVLKSASEYVVQIIKFRENGFTLHVEDNTSLGFWLEIDVDLRKEFKDDERFSGFKWPLEPTELEPGCDLFLELKDNPVHELTVRRILKHHDQKDAEQFFLTLAHDVVASGRTKTADSNELDGIRYSVGNLIEINSLVLSEKMNRVVLIIKPMDFSGFHLCLDIPFDFTRLVYQKSLSPNKK